MLINKRKEGDRDMEEIKENKANFGWIYVNSLSENISRIVKSQHYKTAFRKSSLCSTLKLM